MTYMESLPAAARVELENRIRERICVLKGDLPLHATAYGFGSMLLPLGISLSASPGKVTMRSDFVLAWSSTKNVLSRT